MGLPLDTYTKTHLAARLQSEGVLKHGAKARIAKTDPLKGVAETDALELFEPWSLYILRRGAAPRIIAGGEGRRFCGPQPPEPALTRIRVNLERAPAGARRIALGAIDANAFHTSESELPRHLLDSRPRARMRACPNAGVPEIAAGWRWNSSGRAASSTTNGISGRLAPTRQALLAPLSRRISLFSFIRGLRAAKPAALTPGHDS
jgi:hypothetical protein